MSWSRLPEKELEEIDGSIPEAPVYKEPDTKTELVDLASAVEDKKTYVAKEGDEKLFSKRKEEGFSMAPPVDVYEPGFRSDLYEAIVDFWREKSKMHKKHDALKAKMGWR